MSEQNLTNDEDDNQSSILDAIIRLVLSSKWVTAMTVWMFIFSALTLFSGLGTLGSSFAPAGTTLIMLAAGVMLFTTLAIAEAINTARQLQDSSHLRQLITLIYTVRAVAISWGMFAVIIMVLCVIYMFKTKVI